MERAGLLGGVKFRLLEVDSKYKLRGESLAEAIRKDKEQGFIPFYVSFSNDCKLVIKSDFENRIRSCRSSQPWERLARARSIASTR